MLLLYKAYGLEGGVLFPVSQRTNGMQPEERFRFGVNFTYFFWPGKGTRTLTMNRARLTAAALLTLVLFPSDASAELRRVRITVLGMD